MTEDEWLRTGDPAAMLVEIHRVATARKLRLFAAATARETLKANATPPRTPTANDPESRSFSLADAAVQELERVADGTGSDSRLRSVLEQLGRVRPKWVWTAVAVSSLADAALRIPPSVRGLQSCLLGGGPVLLPRAADLLREVFGNLYRPPAFAPRWRTADVTGLANGIYADRAFDRLPLLADALMDAGCDDEPILTHCRSAGPHARGCWIVDLVLDKR